MACEPTLPGRHFWAPDVLAREQDAVFGQMRACVGRAGDIPRPGDFRTAELGGENVLLVRGDNGAARAFISVCRHCGAPLRDLVLARLGEAR